MSIFRVKICGITNARDAKNAATVGADAIGFNFYPHSRRYVQPLRAAEIAQTLPDSLQKVGVFVNASIDTILTVADQVGLDAIQLHGDEPAELLQQLSSRMVIRAFRCAAGSISEIRRYLDRCGLLHAAPAAVLLDACQPRQYGGTGQIADWKSARQIVTELVDTPCLLAGGLTRENVARAIAAVGPTAVDVAGGVEIRPGQKDLEKMRGFVKAARAALGV